MSVNRREFIVGLTALTGIRFLAPIVVRAGAGLGHAAADPASAARNRLVVVFLAGGNDGLNTVVPMDDVGSALRRSVYDKVRPDLAYAPSDLLPLSRTAADTTHQLGLNPKLRTLHGLYAQGRVAIVQGVDYPKHSYSHFISTDIWQSGRPDTKPDSGWIGRHLDRAGIGDGELRGLGIGTELPLTLQGQQRHGVEVETIPATRFRDGTSHSPVAGPRHDAFARFGAHPADEPMRHFAGKQAEHTVGLVDALEGVTAPPPVQNKLAYALLTARTLLEDDSFGVECVFVWHAGGQGAGGYDTHAAQKRPHERLLSEFDAAVEAFYFGTIAGKAVVPPLSPGLASKTLLLTTSEFGRRIGQSGAGDTAGSDHGAAGPLFLVGPPADAPGAVALAPGIHGEHPPMGTTVSPADNLVMTTDLRRVYQSVLVDWLSSSDPVYEEGRHDPLTGLFHRRT